MGELKWVIGTLLTFIGITLGVITALKRTFLLRSEFSLYKEDREDACKKYREGCERLHKKDAEIQQKDLEMRDAAISRLEQKTDQLFEELKRMRSEFREDFCGLKKFIETQLNNRGKGGNG